MIRVTPGQLPAWVDKTNKKHRAALLRGIHKTTPEVQAAVKIRTGNIKPHAPIHTGDYRNRWRFSNNSNGGRVFNESPVAGIIELGVASGRIPLPRLSKPANKGKAGFRKFKTGKKIGQWRTNAAGRRTWFTGAGGGGPVPMKAILRWCYLKFRVTQVFKQTKKNPRGSWGRHTVFKSENAAWGLAVAVQRGLHYKGIKPRRVLTHPMFVRKTVDITRDNTRRELAKVAHD